MLPTDEKLDYLVGCHCNSEVQSINYNISDNRIEILLVCSGCGRIVSVSGPIDEISDITLKKTPRYEEHHIDCD